MNGKYIIKRTKTFDKELRNIYKYISVDLKELSIGKRFVEHIVRKLIILERFPSIGKLLRKEKDFEYRKFIIKNYIIIYKVDLNKKEVYILHIYNEKFNYPNE